MKLIVLLLYMGLTAEAVNVQVLSLFPAASYRVGRLISFSVEPVNGRVSEVTAVELNAEAHICNVTVDPYRTNYFHILCSEEYDLSLTVHINSEGRQYKTTLRGIQILPPLSQVAIETLPTPTPSPTPPPINEFEIGRAIFENDCLICHRTRSIDKSRASTIEDIKKSFKLSDMLQFDGVFSDQQLNGLKEYIDQKY